MNTGKKRKFMMWFILLIPVFLLGLHLGAIIAYTPKWINKDAHKKFVDYLFKIKSEQ